MRIHSLNICLFDIYLYQVQLKELGIWRRTCKNPSPQKLTIWWGKIWGNRGLEIVISKKGNFDQLSNSRVEDKANTWRKCNRKWRRKDSSGRDKPSSHSRKVNLALTEVYPQEIVNMSLYQPLIQLYLPSLEFF